MLNLYHLLQLHFPGQHALLDDAWVRQRLDRTLDLVPDELGIYIYRVQRELLDRFGEEAARPLLTLLWYLQRIYAQIEIYYSAVIGEDLRVIHGLGTVIGARVAIGDHVRIYQNVTIGSREHETHGRPVIGDNSVIYPGSRILGDITIGRNCLVGANAVVLDSFPDNSVIAGVPARLIRTRETAA